MVNPGFLTNAPITPGQAARADRDRRDDRTTVGKKLVRWREARPSKKCVDQCTAKNLGRDVPYIQFSVTPELGPATGTKNRYRDREGRRKSSKSFSTTFLGTDNSMDLGTWLTFQTRRSCFQVTHFARP